MARRLRRARLRRSNATLESSKRILDAESERNGVLLELAEVRAGYEDVEGMLTRFPVLGEKRRALAGTLSGGEQQILEVAIALLLHPRLLLVDEPSLGLAPRMVEAVFDTIVAINRGGTTVLMVEQNAKKALAICHRAFVLELGRNRFEGTRQEPLDNPEVRAHYLGG